MASMDATGDLPREGAKMGGRKRSRRAAGGSMPNNQKARTSEKVNEYNASGSPEMKEATERTPSFRRGGAMKEGGDAEGEMMDKKRYDRQARGGRAMGGSKSPYSSGAMLSPPATDKDGRGYENAKPA
jgi:hypothetical protein